MNCRYVYKFESLAVNQQVVGEIRPAIADGEIPKGMRRLRALDLATTLDLNKSAVLRAPWSS